MRTERASDEAAAQNVERRQGITQRAGVQIDRRTVQYTPQSQVGNLQISRGQQVTQREELGAGARTRDRNAGAALRQQRFEGQLNRNRRQGQKLGAPGGGGSISPRQAASLAKKNPYVMAATTAAGALSGNLDKTEIQQTFGRGCVKMLWQNLWMTFGHSVYFLAAIFLATSQSRYARKYFPRIGEEWFPPDLLKKIPKAARVPLQLAETLGLLFVLFWVLVLDISCLGMFAFLLGILLSVANAV